jgi:hypothetical protein
MTRLLFHISEQSIPTDPDDQIHVLLYGSSPPHPHVGVVGNKVLDIASRLVVRPSTAAMDFLAIAMAVTAADTFVSRDAAADRWSRSFEIVVPLANPDVWQTLKPLLERTLRFLSSDMWNFVFTSGGIWPPLTSEIKRRRNIVDLSKVDCVALFSGGLDSAIGAIDLLNDGKRPLLVSHAPQGDAERQEIVAGLLPSACERLSVNSYPTWSGFDDDSMRTRSFQFLALGALAAQSIATYRGTSSVDLFVCENGLIALNAPLTPRRMGSHSTRTAHPYFLRSVSELIAALEIPVRIVNPYRHMTKGEMVARHHNNPKFEAFAAETVSCGKWKRKHEQCGRCVPCLIRRASLYAGNVSDETIYKYPDLHAVMGLEDGRDDLIAVQSALIRGGAVERWVLQAGPLPEDMADRQLYFNVAKRGMAELASYLSAEGFKS